MGIQVDYADGRFSLASPGDLSPEGRDYAENYLQKISRYQVIGHYQGSPVFSLYQPPILSQAGIRAFENRLRRRFEGARFPATATISVTKACQCACTHCSAAFYNGSKVRSLSTSLFNQAIHESVELGVTTVIFLGGEPTLNADLPELVQSVPKNLATSILFTNGEFLTRDLVEKLATAGLMGAFVSIDSDIPEDHDRWRGRRGLFDKAIEGIATLREAGVLVGISSHLSPEQVANGMLGRMMALGQNLGVCEVTFFDAIPSGRFLHETTCLLQPEDRELIQKEVARYRRAGGYPGISAQSTMTSEGGSAFCFAGNTQFYLTAAGEMCPCDFTPLSIGKFPECSIEALWQEMVSAEPYATRAKSCRMQDPDFRRRYIDRIPKEGPYPYPMRGLALPLV